MLGEMAERLLQSRSFEGVIETILDDVIALHQAQYGNVQLPIGDDLAIVAQRGFSRDFLETFRRVKAGDGTACDRALRSGEPLIVADVHTDPDFAPFREAARRAGFRSVQSTPLVMKDGRVLAVVSTHFAKPEGPRPERLDMLRLYRRMAVEQACELLGNATLADTAAGMSDKLYGAASAAVMEPAPPA